MRVLVGLFLGEGMEGRICICVRAEASGVDRGGIYE